MSHPAQPMPSAGRPVGPSSARDRPNEQRDFPDLSATVRPNPAPISTQANPLFRNAVSLPSSPTLREKFMHTSSRVVRVRPPHSVFFYLPSRHAHLLLVRSAQLVDVRSTPTNLLWNLFTHACSQARLCPFPFFLCSLLISVSEQNHASDAYVGSFGLDQRAFGWDLGRLLIPRRRTFLASPPPLLFFSPLSPLYQARAALNLGCDIFSVSPALESDLASLPALKRLNFDQMVGFHISPFILRLTYIAFRSATYPRVTPTRTSRRSRSQTCPRRATSTIQVAFVCLFTRALAGTTCSASQWLVLPPDTPFPATRRTRRRASGREIGCE